MKEVHLIVILAGRTWYVHSVHKKLEEAEAWQRCLMHSHTHDCRIVAMREDEITAVADMVAKDEGDAGDVK